MDKMDKLKKKGSVSRQLLDSFYSIVLSEVLSLKNNMLESYDLSLTYEDIAQVFMPADIRQLCVDAFVHLRAVQLTGFDCTINGYKLSFYLDHHAPLARWKHIGTYVDHQHPAYTKICEWVEWHSSVREQWEIVEHVWITLYNACVNEDDEPIYYPETSGYVVPPKNKMAGNARTLQHYCPWATALFNKMRQEKGSWWNAHLDTYLKRGETPTALNLDREFLQKVKECKAIVAGGLMMPEAPERTSTGVRIEFG